MNANEPAAKNRWQTGLLRVTQILVMIVAAILLASHVTGWDAFRVDGVTLALLAFLVMIPLVELIRKIKVGDFEAEIGRDEVARVQAMAAPELPPSVGSDVEASGDRLRALLREDPRLALAKVRIELEEALKRLSSSSTAPEPDWRRLSLSRLLERLVREEVLPSGMAGALRDVITLANRAVHGEHVDPTAAEDLALLGNRLLQEIQQLTFERILRPAETSSITQAEVEQHRAAKYRVRTVVPLVDRPVRNTYILDQAALDEFLEGYEEYAEFLVSIEPMPA